MFIVDPDDGFTQSVAQMQQNLVDYYKNSLAGWFFLLTCLRGLNLLESECGEMKNEWQEYIVQTPTRRSAE